jgi:hypothetical protein
LLDDLEFKTPQPPKDWNERKELTANQLNVTGKKISVKASQVKTKVLDGSVEFSIAVDSKAKKLYEKHKDKSWAKKISSVIGKKVDIVDTHNRAASMEEAAPRSQSVNS